MPASERPPLEKNPCEFVEMIEITKGKYVPICKHPRNNNTACLPKCAEAHRELAKIKYSLKQCYKRNERLKKELEARKAERR